MPPPDQGQRSASSSPLHYMKPPLCDALVLRWIEEPCDAELLEHLCLDALSSSGPVELRVVLQCMP